MYLFCFKVIEQKSNITEIFLKKRIQITSLQLVFLKVFQLLGETLS